MAERTTSREAWTIAALAALSVYALALLSPAIFNDGDTYWHIRAGEWMLAHHAVLTQDPFSLSFAGKPWDTQEWLSEIAMAGAFQVFSWSGVAVLTGLAMAAAVALLALYLAKRLYPVPCIVVLGLAAICVMPDFLARPHILALPVLTAWTVGLADAGAARRAPRWSLLPIMVLWANLHGSFVFGLALIFPFALEVVLAEGADRLQAAKNWGLFALGAAGAALLNPRGVNGLVYPFVLMHLQSLSAVGEWQSPDFHGFQPVETAASAAIFFLVWRGVRLPAVRLLLLLALFHLWLEHARYGMLLGIVGAIVVAEPIGRVLRRSSAAPRPQQHPALFIGAAVAAMLVCAAVRVAYPIPRIDSPSSPVAALASVPNSLASQPVFNDYAFGGYLIFHGIRPLVDSRADLYGDDYLNEYSRAIGADKSTVDAVFRKYAVRWTILAPGDPLVAAMDRRHGWRRLYADSYAVVHVATAASPSTVAATLIAPKR